MGVYIPYIPRLPSEYQEVEYIGRNGNNYINTGWTPTTNFTINAGYKIADSGYRYVLLSNYGGGTTSHSISLEINSGDVSTNKVRFYCGTTSTTQFYSSNSLNLNSFNDITITAPGTINLNGTTTTGSMYSGSYDSKSCYLFMIRDTATSNWNTFSHNPFVSYCKIYEGSTLVRDFVPCYRKSDSVIGLYDLVNNQFYTNSGTGTFSKGNDVTMVEMKNAYIGEVWTPTSNTIAYYPLTASTTTNDLSGNGKNLTKSGSTAFGTYGGVSCASMSGYLYNGNLSGTLTALTMSCWFWEISKSGNYYLMMGLKSGTSGTDTSNLFFMFEGDGRPSGTGFGLQYGESWSINSGTATSKGAWHNGVITWDGSVIKAYLDGTQVATKNRTTAVARNTIMIGWGSYADKYMSEAIYENVCWNADKVLNYYNTFKAQYGL